MLWVLKTPECSDMKYKCQTFCESYYFTFNYLQHIIVYLESWQTDLFVMEIFSSNVFSMPFHATINHLFELLFRDIKEI